MKKKLLILSAFALSYLNVNAQSGKYWSSHSDLTSKITTDKSVARQTFPKEFKLYDLNIENLKTDLFSVINSKTGKQSVIITLPNADGKMEQFEVFEASNFEPSLQLQFPEIRAYSGKGITDKYATLKLSIAPSGIQTMVFRTDKENEFIEPYSQDHKTYAVFKSQRNKNKLNWACGTIDEPIVKDLNNKLQNTQKINTGQLRTMRLAQSVTAEYSNYFGATSSAQVGSVLTAINNTLTRCNGVYEKDLALHLNLVATTTNVIYYDPLTDPYDDAATGAGGTWNAQLQGALTANIGEANYDIGHLFGASGGGGNAGCIGCVCVDNQKGSGFTSPADGIPSGDNFDIDYVVHEVGHQLGGNHTFSMQENNAVNMEPGSGVTIMGYAGITSVDIAPHSIDTYHAGSIAQIQTNLLSKACPVTTNISLNNATPTANAGLDYAIPKSTPFKLTGSATDTNSGDVLTYQWEEVDDATTVTAAASAASATKTTGPNWRSYSPNSSPSRNFPLLASTLANSQTTQGTEIAVEALSSVARTLNFRLTVRDNAPYSSTAPVKVGQTNFDDTVITVSGTVGPFDVTSQATVDQTWTQNTSQTITWTVNGTNVPYAANVPGDQFVDILLSTDGGLTFSTVLANNTPNDGSEVITVPNITATNARVMVKAHTHIFYDINPQPIAIGYTISNTCNTYTNNTPLPIPDDSPDDVNPGTIATSDIIVPVTYNLTDVNVGLNVSHTWPNDLLIALDHPDTTQDMLWNRNCAGNDNFNVTLSDGSASFTCVTNMTGTFSPASPLSVFNGKVANGTWTLLAGDCFAADSGTINSWFIEVCNKTFTLANEEFEFQDFRLFPNPNNGNFTVKFTSEAANEVKISVNDIRGRQVFEKSYSNNGIFDQTINLQNMQAGVYLVSVTDGVKKTVKRIVIE